MLTSGGNKKFNRLTNETLILIIWLLLLLFIYSEMGLYELDAFNEVAADF